MLTAPNLRHLLAICLISVPVHAVAEVSVAELESLIGTWKCSTKSAQFTSSFSWILDKSHVEHTHTAIVFGTTHRVKEIIGWDAETKSILGRIFSRDWTATSTWVKHGNSWEIAVVLIRKDGTQSKKSKTLTATADSLTIIDEGAPVSEFKKLEFTRVAPVKIGKRLELFVDDQLIDDIHGDVQRKLLKPEPKEVVFVTDEPWEGNTSGYYTFFQDGGIYRMIYRGWQHDEQMKAAHKEVTCYAESEDGIHWTKPKLGLFEWKGSKENNIVWLGTGTHNFTAFRDDNPKAPVESRYKAFGGIGDFGGGLVPFGSPDCVNWKQTRDKPVITNGAFDSQNLAFWDIDREEYRAYWRYFGDGVRSIRTATSQDFMTWENEADLTYTEGTPREHLYTNAIQKYFRAPHLFIGFPTRYEPKSQQVEPILMSSRDGKTFHRHAEAVIPRTAPQDRNHNRSNYMAWGMFQLPDRPKEISVYATENYYEPTPGRVRRFAYRVDGFVALRGGNDGGTVTTKPLRFEGQRLLLNYVVQPGGELTIETLDESAAVTGRSKPLTGDAVDAPVVWQQAPDFSQGIVQLRFTIKNADVYSLRFN